MTGAPVAEDEQLRRVLREIASVAPPADRFPLEQQIRVAWRRVVLVAAILTAAVIVVVVLIS